MFHFRRAVNISQTRHVIHTFLPKIRDERGFVRGGWDWHYANAKEKEMLSWIESGNMRNPNVDIIFGYC